MPRLYAPVTERDHVRGSTRASVTLVEYGDFQCPFCGEAYPIVNALEARFQRDLRVVFRHFPLTEVHPLAMGAAEAAEAAGAQGRFWEMHDLLYLNQPDFAPAMLLGYARELVLDLEAFTEDLVHHRWRRRIRDDFMGGIRSGVNATPCLFIDDVRFDGPVDEDLLAIAIERARAHHQAEITSSRGSP